MRAFVIAMEDEAEAVRVALRATGGRWKVEGGTMEFSPLHCSTSNLQPPTFSNLLFVSGIGKVNAAAAAQRAIDLGATEIINAGLAGGFVKRMTNEELRITNGGHVDSSHQALSTKHQAPISVGGVYEVKSAVEYDFDLAQINGTAVGVLDERTTPFIPMATTGKFPAKILATGDHFNDKEDDYRLITDELGAELRDMEGAAIAHVCEKAGIPCRALKCVTNVAGLGSMVGQFEENRKRCLAILSEAMKTWLADELKVKVTNDE